MDTPNKYKSVVPSEMTERELNNMCRDIQTAIDRKLPFTRVRLQNDMRCRVETARLKEYKNALKSMIHESLSAFEYLTEAIECIDTGLYKEGLDLKYEQYINRLNK